MIELYGWGPLFDCPSPSPYVMKSDIQLQLLGVEFTRAIADLESVPKHKAPYVKDGDLLIEDSNFIRAHFEAKLGRSLDDTIPASERPLSWALERMVEGHLTSFLSYERWVKDDNFNKGPAIFFMSVPEMARAQVIAETREGIARMHHGTGFARFSEAERLQLARWDLSALTLQLGGKSYLLGDQPCAADASVAAVLISAATEFFDSPLPGFVREFPELMTYAERMKESYLSHAAWPVPEMA